MPVARQMRIGNRRATTTTMEALTLQFKGQALRLQLAEGEQTTVEQLQREIERLAGVPAEAQRIFYGKRRVDTSEPQRLLVESCQGLASSPTLLLLAGATKQTIQSMNETQTAVIEEQRIRENRTVVNIAQKNQQFQAREAVATNYRFHDIRELKQFKDRAKAREILERLANDRGILAVMEKHKWTVGALSEMYPDGKVGVDPVCVLGLNKNKGQEILLRLRTDDLLGFRKYLSIKKVLFHELSHNVHSEHDSKFYQLMRQVERECDELDWTHSSGAVTGGSASGFAEGGSTVSSGSGGSSGQKLGGVSDRLSSRLLSEETKPQVPKPIDQKPAPSPSRKRSLEAEQMEVDAPLATETPSSPNGAESQESPAPSVSADVPAAIPHVTPTPVQPLPEPSDEFADFPMSERERRVYSALRTLQSHYDDQVVAAAASVLYKIVSNILQHPGESKYRSIRKANRVFESRVGHLPECLEFLLAVGFVDQSESFVLARDDPALLWIGRSTLEVMLPASA